MREKNDGKQSKRKYGDFKSLFDLYGEDLWYHIVWVMTTDNITTTIRTSKQNKEPKKGGKEEKAKNSLFND